MAFTRLQFFHHSNSAPAWNAKGYYTDFTTKDLIATARKQIAAAIKGEI